MKRGYLINLIATGMSIIIIPTIRNTGVIFTIADIGNGRDGKEGFF